MRPVANSPLSRVYMLVHLALVSGALASCDGLQEPRTLGETNTGYNYIPLDPLEVDVLISGPLAPNATALDMRRLRYTRCVSRDSMDGNPDAGDKAADVMDALPDHTIRMAIRTLSGQGEGGFGPVKMSAKGSTYQVVADSIFADTANVRFAMRAAKDGKSVPVKDLTDSMMSSAVVDVRRLERGEPLPQGYEEVIVPAYVGIGLRLTANLIARKGGINLSNLPAIAASADAEESSGTLTLQTLGVYNQQVASTFAIPSELSTTSVQNALVSLGSVKAIVYDRDTGTRPRLTGIYNPLPTSHSRLINKIYAALAQRPITWAPCASS